MSGLRQIAVAVYDRDRFSRGNMRKTFGYEAFHWGILIVPKESQGRNCDAYEATDASTIDKVTFRMVNPNMEWWFRASPRVDPLLSTKFLGCIIIGEIPDAVSNEDVYKLFENIPVPIKHTDPQQSCVTWVVNAIKELQSQTWVVSFDVKSFQDMVLSYADDRLARVDTRQFVRYTRGQLAGA